MNWKKITVGQYQQIYPILIEDNWTRLDKLTKVISIVTGKSEDEVDSMPLNALKDYEDIFDMPKMGKPLGMVKVNGRRYRLVYDIQKLPAARYIEGKTFSQDGIITNLHSIMASCVMPQKRFLWWYRDAKYDASRHSEYAQDMKDVPFLFAYNACVFFCKVFVNWTDYFLSSSEQEFKGMMTKDQGSLLKKSFRGITDGLIPQYL
jgi:hypothetical protein